MKLKRVIVKLDAKAIGRRIRKTRRGYGWKVKHLAAKTGIAWKTICCYECGASIPRRDNVVALALALRRTVDFILLGKRDTRAGRL